MGEKIVPEKTENKMIIPENKWNLDNSDASILDTLNRNQPFMIGKKGSRFTLSHISTSEPISLRITTLEQAIEIRKFLNTLNIVNQSCIQQEGLYQCLLENPENNPYSRWIGNTNDVFRVKDGTIARLMKTPFLALELLPASIKEKSAATVDIIKNYMNATMRASHQTMATK